MSRGVIGISMMKLFVDATNGSLDEDYQPLPGSAVLGVASRRLVLPRSSHPDQPLRHPRQITACRQLPTPHLGPKSLHRHVSTIESCLTVQSLPPQTLIVVVIAGVFNECFWRMRGTVMVFSSLAFIFISRLRLLSCPEL